MKESVTLAPPNSLILVMDHSFGELPEAMGGQLVAFTDSCIAVGTLSESEGDTNVALTDDLEDGVLGNIVFDGIVKAPQCELSVCSVANEKLLTMKLSNPEAHVRIFTNDLFEPDEIVVLVVQDNQGWANQGGQSDGGV